MNTASAVEISMRLRGSDSVRSELRATSQASEEMANRMGVGLGSLDRASFRVQQRMQGVALGVLGIRSPIDGLIGKFEYLQFMADRMNTSIGTMAMKFAPSIALAGAAAVATSVGMNMITEDIDEWDRKLTDLGYKQSKLFGIFRTPMAIAERFGWVDPKIDPEQVAKNNAARAGTSAQHALAALRPETLEESVGRFAQQHSEAIRNNPKMISDFAQSEKERIEARDEALKRQAADEARIENEFAAQRLGRLRGRPDLLGELVVGSRMAGKWSGLAGSTDTEKLATLQGVADKIKAGADAAKASGEKWQSVAESGPHLAEFAEVGSRAAYKNTIYQTEGTAQQRQALEEARKLNQLVQQFIQKQVQIAVFQMS